MKSIVHILLILTFYTLSCKSSEETPAVKGLPKQAGSLLTEQALQLVDGTQLPAPQSEVTLGSMCGTDTYKIKVKTFDEKAEYFQFRLCDPQNPTQCVPTDTDVEAAFAHDELEIPNLLSDKDIRQPILQIRTCVRPYDAKDPAQNCGTAWETVASVPSAYTDDIVRPLLWEDFTAKAQITKQCFRILEAAQAYLKAKEGQEINPDLRKALELHQIIGVDNCTRLIESGAFEELAGLLADSLPKEVEKKEIEKKEVEKKDETSSTSFLSSFSSSYSAALALLIVPQMIGGMGAITIYSYGWHLEAQKLKSVHGFLTESEFKDFKTNEMTPRERFQAYLEQRYKVRGISDFEVIYKTFVENQIANVEEMEKRMNSQWIEKRLYSAAARGELEIKNGMVTEKAPGAFQKLGWSEEQFPNGKKHTVKLENILKDTPRGFRPHFNNIQEKLSKTTPEEFRQLVASEDFLQTHKKFGTPGTTTNKVQEIAKSDQKSMRRWSRIAGSAAVLLGVAGAVLIPLSATGNLALNDSPEQNLMSVTKDVVEQVRKLKEQLAGVWLQIDACTLPTLGAPL